MFFIRVRVIILNSQACIEHHLQQLMHVVFSDHLVGIELVEMTIHLRAWNYRFDIKYDLIYISLDHILFGNNPFTNVMSLLDDSCEVQSKSSRYLNCN